MTSDSNVPIIRVDRSDVTYPPKIKHRIVRPLHPEFETTGPDEYRLNDLWLWPPDAEKWKDRVMMADTYRELKRSTVLEYCLSRYDLRAIQALGNEVFYVHLRQRHFVPRRIFGWKSVALTNFHNHRVVPYLTLDNHDPNAVVEMEWAILDSPVPLDQHDRTYHFMLLCSP